MAENTGGGGGQQWLGPAIQTGGEVLGAILGGGGTTTEGMTLPPALEYEMLEAIGQDLTMYQDLMKNLESTKQMFNKKLEILDKGLAAGQLSDDQMKAMTQLNAGIAQSFGASAQDLAASGFLTPDEVAGLEELKKLEGTDTQVQDTVLEGQISDERAKLEQELARSGASPATRAQALQQFDRQANESRYMRSNELKTFQSSMITGRLGLASDLRREGQATALTGQGVITGAMDRQLNILSGRSNLLSGQVQTNVSLDQAQANYAAGRLGTFAKAGEFKYSGGTKELLERGYFGMGNPAVQSSAEQKWGLGQVKKVAPNVGMSGPVAGLWGYGTREREKELEAELQKGTKAKIPQNRV